MSISSRHRGFTLIETIMVIVILAIAAGTIFISINRAAMESAEAVPRKQAISIAESLLEEVSARPFILPTATDPTVTLPVVIGSATAGEQRIATHKVADYHNLTMTGIRRLEAGDTAIASLAGYTASITVVDTAFGSIAGTDSKLITVTVTGPGGVSVTLQAFKIKTDIEET